MLFESTITGAILNDGQTTETSGITAGQLATVLTAYTPLTDTVANTTSIGTNSAAVAALQTQVAAIPPPPDLAPYALAANLAAAEGSIAANGSSITALNSSLTTGLAGKASQAALDTLQLEVNGKSTPASVDLKLANHPTTAAMNSAIASADNAVLATVAATYGLKTVTDQLAIDVAARQTAADVSQAIGTALLPYTDTTGLNAAVALRTTPADVDQKVATALLPLVTQVALDAALAIRDGRLGLPDGGPGLERHRHRLGGLRHHRRPAELRHVGGPHRRGDEPPERDRLHPGPTGRPELRGQQSDQRSGLAGRGDLGPDDQEPALHRAPVRQPARGSRRAHPERRLRLVFQGGVRRQPGGRARAVLHLGPDRFGHRSRPGVVLHLRPDGCGHSGRPGPSTTVQMDAAIAAALVPYYTSLQTDSAIAAALVPYYTSAQTDAAIAAALVPYSTTVQVDAAIAAALVPYSTTVQMDAAIAAAVGGIDLSGYYTAVQTDAAIAAALVPVTLSNAPAWVGNTTWELLKGTNVLRNLHFAAPTSASLQNNTDTLSVSIDLSDYVPWTGLQAPIINEINIALTDYWTQTETSTEIANQIAAAGHLTQAQGDARYFPTNAAPDGGGAYALMLDIFTPRMLRNLLPRAPLSITPLFTNGRTLELEVDCYSKSESDSRYFPVNAAPDGGGGFALMVDTQTPRLIRSIIPRAPLNVTVAGGNGGTLDIQCDAYSKSEADNRYFSVNAAPDGGGAYSLMLDIFTPRMMRAILPRAPLSATPRPSARRPPRTVISWRFRPSTPG